MTKNEKLFYLSCKCCKFEDLALELKLIYRIQGLGVTIE